MAQSEVVHECRSCDGTGVFVASTEPLRTGTVCYSCKGTGRMVFKFTPFTQRQTRNDVDKVRLTSVRCDRCDAKPVTYEEFLAGKMPE